MVRVIRVGLDGTDHEIYEGDYGEAPEGSDFLIMGHESFGVVEAVGPAVEGIAPGDFVVARVRRAGSSFYDQIGMPDFTTDEDYYEHGISRVHGFLTEQFVEDPEYLIKNPRRPRDIAVLLEPTSIVEKGIAQAFEIQRRLSVLAAASAPRCLGSGNDRASRCGRAPRPRTRGASRSVRSERAGLKTRISSRRSAPRTSAPGR